MDCGTEFVFRIPAERKTSPPVGFIFPQTCSGPGKRTTGGEFSAIERYAIAKMALFQAFDERAGPAEMSQPVLVRAADLDAIVERLNITAAHLNRSANPIGSMMPIIARAPR